MSKDKPEDLVAELDIEITPKGKPEPLPLLTVEIDPEIPPEPPSYAVTTCYADRTWELVEYTRTTNRVHSIYTNANEAWAKFRELNFSPRLVRARNEWNDHYGARAPKRRNPRKQPKRSKYNRLAEP